MGIKTSLFSPNRKNDCAADSDNTFSSLNGRARQQLYEVEPDLVPYYDAIYKMVNSQEDFFMPRSTTQLDDGLYLGSLEDARDLEILRYKNITCIINTAESSYEDDESHTQPLYDETFKYMGFDAKDAEGYPIMTHFDDIHRFIEDANKNNQKCLIHCMRGVNRSGVLATAYIMVKNKIGPITATQIVYKKRGMLLSNCTFISQLLLYAKENEFLELDKDHVLLNKGR